MKKSSSKKSKVPRRSGQVLVTQNMLSETKYELKGDITSVHLEVRSLKEDMNGRFLQLDGRFKNIDSQFTEMDGRFKQIDARFTEMDARFEQIDARFLEIDGRFQQIDSRFSHVDSKLEKIIAIVHRTNALVEEQNSRNRVVLEGYDQLYRIQQEHDRRLKNLEN